MSLISTVTACKAKPAPSPLSKVVGHCYSRCNSILMRSLTNISQSHHGLGGRAGPLFTDIRRNHILSIGEGAFDMQVSCQLKLLEHHVA